MADPMEILQAITTERMRDGIYASIPSEEPERELVGIELYPLALQYLFGSNVFPLQTTVGIAGAAKAGKSSLAIWILKEFLKLGGIGIYVDTELKHAGELISTILGEYTPRVRHLLVNTLEQAHESCNASIQQVRTMAPDFDVPLIIVLDSLYGALSEEEMSTYSEEGHLGRRFSPAAMINSSFFKMVGKVLVGYPATLVVVNHYAQNLQTPGYYLPGGERQIYMTSCYMRAKKISEINRAAEEGRVVRLEMFYSSIGPTPRAIDLEITWRFEDNEGKAVQVFDFKWDDATARLLYAKRNVLKDVLDIACDRNLYSSSTLGVARVRSEGFMAAFHEHPDIVDAVRTKLGIRHFRIYRPDDADVIEYFRKINVERK